MSFTSLLRPSLLSYTSAAFLCEVFFFIIGGVGGSGLASHGLLQQADTWPLAPQRIKPTWKTPKRRWRGWEGGGTVEQTSGFTDTEECCQSAQECRGLVFPWGPKTLFLPTPNSSISTSKMKHTSSCCLSHHLESCTPLNLTVYSSKPSMQCYILPCCSNKCCLT